MFPLPSTVLFPGTVLPLHVFEPRYRDMVSDALAGDGSMAIVLERTGVDERGLPLVHTVAGGGRIIHAERLADGRFNILLQGLSRVRLLDELPLDRRYRRFRADVIAAPTEPELKEAHAELAKLQSCVLALRSVVAERDAPMLEVLRSTSDPLELADILAASMISSPAVQQELLASINLRTRLAQLVDALADAMVRMGEPDGAALN